MIDQGKPDAAVAFTGGRGTADMVARLLIANIPLLDEDTRPLEERNRRAAAMLKAAQAAATPR
jgi:alpha-D-ribose 1-methylphosphonate 5-triphosphate synthase subunit PhnL